MLLILIKGLVFLKKKEDVRGVKFDFYKKTKKNYNCSIFSKKRG